MNYALIRKTSTDMGILKVTIGNFVDKGTVIYEKQISERLSSIQLEGNSIHDKP